MAKTNIDISTSVINKAEKFLETGIKPLDAIHLASAIKAGADLLCTVDKSFLHKASSVNTNPTRVVSPVELKIALFL